jgi:hypothetical protein
MDSCRIKFRNIFPMSMSPMKVFLSTALNIVFTVGRGNRGTQIASLNPNRVPSYTILTSSVPLGTAKKEVKE